MENPNGEARVLTVLNEFTEMGEAYVGVGGKKGGI
jgi:hypothetical protein